MTGHPPVFSGSKRDAMKLNIAILHHCTCEETWTETSVVCPAHAMLRDQRILNGLDCERRRVKELLRQEFTR